MDHMVIGARPGSLGNSAEFEKQQNVNISLSDRLKPFKSSQFDSDGFINTKCPTVTEKELKQLTVYLKDLKKASADEMRKSVYANYTAFIRYGETGVIDLPKQAKDIRTAKEISALEGQLLSLRNLLQSHAAVIHGLSDGVHVNSLSPGLQGPLDSEISDHRNSDFVKMETWLEEFLENLEVLLEERRTEEALDALDKGEKVVTEANDRKTLNSTTLNSLQNAVTKSRQKLADQLVDTAKQGSTKGAELRSVILALKRLGDGPRAHTLLLNSHHQKLQVCLQSVKPATKSGGGAIGASLSRLAFSTIAQASTDSLAVFGEDNTFTSELVTWAVKETEHVGVLLKRQCLASSAASGNLKVAAVCVQDCLGHCSLLESQGLALSPILLRHFKPLVGQALKANLRRIELSTAALAASDDWSLTLPDSEGPYSGVTTPQPKLSASAHKFNFMTQELFEDVNALETLQLVNPLLEGLQKVFNSYVNTLTMALPGAIIEEGAIVKLAENESQQLTLLINALSLADECLPRAASRLLPAANRDDEPSRRDVERQNRALEQREWKKRLQKSVDKLRDSFCRQHALELIFTEDGEIRLNAHIYTSMVGNSDEHEWFPSPIFQELCIKVNRIAALTSENFIGRERYATMLLMRMTETVILWLSDEQTFWEEIEQGAKPLGPLGLQQFYLDMEFVILFSSQGRFLSRNLQQVAKDIIARAIEAVSATGVDPYSTLPDDEWFDEVAQVAIKILSGNDYFAGEQQEPLSPPPET